MNDVDLSPASLAAALRELDSQSGEPLASSGDALWELGPGIVFWRASTQGIADPARVGEATAGCAALLVELDGDPGALVTALAALELEPALVLSCQLAKARARRVTPLVFVRVPGFAAACAQARAALESSRANGPADPSLAVVLTAGVRQRPSRAPVVDLRTGDVPAALARAMGEHVVVLAADLHAAAPAPAAFAPVDTVIVGREAAGLLAAWSPHLAADALVILDGAAGPLPGGVRAGPSIGALTLALAPGSSAPAPGSRAPARRAPAHERISLIMPTRDEGGRLERTVRSLFAATSWPDLELVIVDDASRDGSTDFLAGSDLASDPRIRLLRQDAPRGQLACRIDGVAAATGTVLAFLDAHLAFAPAWLENLHAALVRRQRRGIVAPAIAVLDPECWEITSTISYGWKGFPGLGDAWHATRDELGDGGRVDWVGGCQIVLAREVYEAIGGLCPLFRGHDFDDVELCVRAALHGHPCFLEPSALIGHYYKSSYTASVRFADLAFNRLLFARLGFGDPGLARARALLAGDPGLAEAEREFAGAAEAIERFARHAPGSVAGRCEHPAPSATLTTVIIPAHNEAAHLPRTLDSLFADRAAPPFEVLVVDDGSTDVTATILASSSHAADPRLRTVRLDDSIGCIRARDLAAGAARGSHLAFLDAHMAVPSGWLARLHATARRLGPDVVVVPAVATLDEGSWTPRSAPPDVFTIDERLDFVWRPAPYPTGMLATAGGCALLMPRALYVAVGGFDLGLKRWGSEFVDLILKVYAHGGACFLEPGVVVGHLFRPKFPYDLSYREVVYNKLRTAFAHFPDAEFARFQEGLEGAPGLAEALADLEGDRAELESLRATRRAANVRAPDWFVRTFLPALQVGRVSP